MVWHTISEKRVIGLYFFKTNWLPETATKRCYATFSFPGSQTTIKAWFPQQDGAPLHYAYIACNYLDQNLGTRLIGRDGPAARPQRSQVFRLCSFSVGIHQRSRTSLLSFIKWGAEEVNLKSRVSNLRTYTKKGVKTMNLAYACSNVKTKGHFEKLLYWETPFLRSSKWAINAMNLLRNNEVQLRLKL